jgi:Ca2+/Na+ antiporter
MNRATRKLESKIDIRLSMFWILVMMCFGVSYLLCNPLSCFNNIMVLLPIFYLVLLFTRGDNLGSDRVK